jgi:uncharacterized membrane protein YjjP (DUF1212 family)
MSDHSTDAAHKLDHAAAASTAMRRQTAWYTTYLIVYGLASAVVVLLIGLVDSPLIVVFWVAAIVGLSVYSSRQKAVRRHFGLRHGVIIGTWAVLYGAVILVGQTWFPGRPAFWIPAAIVVGAPALIGAWLERRR